MSEAHSKHKPHLTHSTHSKKLLVPYCLSNLVSSKKAAFTLAEVLITLAIIGIVAAMTIPTLVAKYQEKVTVTRFKWVYSTLANAFTMAVAENGVPETWDLNTPESMANILSKYMRISEKCHHTKGCFPDNVDVVALTGESRYGTIGNLDLYVKEKFNNGIVLLYTSVNKNCAYVYTDSEGTPHNMTNNCGTIYAFITTNKFNRMGLDHFNFVITPKGILPLGYNFNDSEIKQYCTKNWTSNSNMNGSACGEWIRRWNNADYWYKD